MEQYQKDFLAKYGDDAQAVQKTYGIPASVVLAQAALESDWGRSGLAASFYNFFGIKGKGSAGTQYLPTTEYENGKYKASLGGFATYLDPKDSFLDYGDFLRRNDRYKPVFGAGADPMAVADALQAAGYATDPKYSTKIKSVIVSNGLTAYDKPQASLFGGTSLINIGQGSGYNPSTVIGSTFGSWEDTNEQQAYDRANAIDPPTHIATDLVEAAKQDAANITKGWIQNSAKVLIVVVLVIVLLVLILQVIPLPPQANIAKKVIANV